MKCAFCVGVTSSGMRSVAAIRSSIYVCTSHVHSALNADYRQDQADPSGWQSLGPVGDGGTIANCPKKGIDFRQAAARW
jgi:hypothetical protein